jgi:hypothetical protein
MFKRITSFSLALCLIMGLSALPISSTAVYAGDAFGEATRIEQEALSQGDDSALTDIGKSVYADDALSEAASIEQAASPGDDYTFTDTDISGDLELPNVSSQVDMTGGLQAPQTLGPFAAMAEQRYTVLVLDTSSAMSFEYNGKIFYTAYTAVEYVKAAAKKFIEGLQLANGTNYVAIVQYKGADATVVSPFSTDLTALSSAIDGLYASQGTRNVAAGLRAANTLISGISDSSAIKNAVLFTTGMTNDGPYSYSGHYGQNTVGSDWRRLDTQIRLYAYANTAYAEAESLKNNATLYTIGLFQTMEDMPARGSEVVQFFKLSALELATSSRYFYDVKDPDDLEFVFGEIAESIVKKSGTFKYPGEGRDNSAVYYYDDAYFYESSYIYNKHLATMSLCLELSAWGSEDVGNSYSLKMVNAQNLLDEIGFTDFDHNYMDFSYNGVGGKPTKDSIGAVAANKSIIANGKDYTLIAVAVRGGGYESEWASNFTIGESGQHTGFKEARDQVIGFLDRYIKNNGRMKK